MYINDYIYIMDYIEIPRKKYFILFHKNSNIYLNIYAYINEFFLPQNKIEWN